MIPASFLLLEAQASFHACFVLQPRQVDASECTEDCLTVILVHAAFVFAKAAIERPVQRVLHGPILAYNTSETLGSAASAVDVVSVT